MKSIIFLLCFLSGLSLASQITIDGRVSDSKGEPLLGVNVYVKGTYDGATTDIEGSFTFTTHASDSSTLIASYIGYHQVELPINGSRSLTITMKEAISELNAVVITAGSFDASDENKRVVLKPLDIVTTAGATADIPGALNTLPGTQAVGETGRLFVRGGEGREAKTFIDGMLVHEAYSPSAPNTPGRSRFSPFMFKGMSFSTGGYSAEYGQALSSALILKSKDIAEDDRTDLSFMTVGADVSKTHSFQNSSIAAKVQYTNLTPYFLLAPQRLDWDKAPEEVNGNVAYRIKTSKTGLLKYYMNMSQSDMDLYEAEIGNPEERLPVSVFNRYGHFNLSYREVFGNQLGFRTGASITSNQDRASLGVSSMRKRLTGYHTKLALDYQHSDRVNVLFGGEVMGRSIDQTLIDETNDIDQDIDERIASVFVESEFFLSTSLAFKTGIRAETDNLRSSTTISPRFSTAYKTSEHSQVSLAFGRFYQSPTTQVLLTDPSRSPEIANHYIANYQWVKEGQSFRMEVYEKRYEDLVKYSNIYDPRTFQSNGHGFARGLDVFWRDNKSIQNLDYWVSYSYLQTERDYQDYPGAFAPPFSSAHNFSVVTKKFIDEIKSQVGLTYSFASARSYHDPNQDQFLGGRTPTYHDVSFNISYLYSNQVIVHAMVNNVLGINNVFGYEYAQEPNASGIYARRAITPPAKRFVFLGIFITLSKNKGINQLPNL